MAMSNTKFSPLFVLSSLALITIALKMIESSESNDSVEIRNNPRMGGWDRKKIAEHNRMTGSKLKHGVNYDPITLEDFKRKGSWATRHYKRKNERSGLNMAPLMNNNGELLPFATQAIVWGEKPPKNRKEQKRLVNKGEKLLKIYRKYKALGYKDRDVLPIKVRKRFKKGLRKKI